MHDFKKLEVWKLSRAIVPDIFTILKQFPKEEMFGLTSQIKRCSISIPSNIAEGCGKGSNKHFSFHLDVAIGSAFELETQLLISSDLNYVSESNVNQILVKLKSITNMIIGLKRSIKNN